jgi:hypothetical protein
VAVITSARVFYHSCHFYKAILSHHPGTTLQFTLVERYFPSVLFWFNIATMAPFIAVEKPQFTSYPSFGVTSTSRFEALSNNVTTDHQAQRKAVLASVRGQTIRIPELAPLFEHWPTKTNSDINLMRLDIREWLDA